MNPYRTAARVLAEARDPTSIWRPMVGMMLLGILIGLSIVGFTVTACPLEATTCHDEVHRMGFAWSAPSCSHPSHRSAISNGNILVCTCGRTP